MCKKPSILVVDDDALTRAFLKELLARDGYCLQEASNGVEAIQKIKKNMYDLVITDLKLGDISGMDVLQEATRQPYGPEVVLITAYGSIESAVEVIKRGAFDYLTKPFDIERVLITLQRALERKKLKRQIVSLRSRLEEKYSCEKIIAESAPMRQILKLIETICMTDSTVLVQGESGTGKELIARAIHYSGPRSGRPFVAVNCAALPEALFESELFGHVKGAFTGALKEKKGLVEEAEGGTLLLDEIGDMPLTVQPKLLRVLEEGQIRRVGSNTMRSVDVRVIAATNRALEPLVKEGTFRNDLFFRLNVIPITVPALRERKEDILPLANHFLDIYRKRMNKEIKGFSPEALEILMSHELKGNVRELENLIQRAITVSHCSFLKADDLLFAPSREGIRQGEKVAEVGALPLAKVNEILTKERDTVEKEHILGALEKSGWNQSQAARDLGISRTTLWSKIKKHGIESPA
jgi:two-component system response regulator AtoC